VGTARLPSPGYAFLNLQKKVKSPKKYPRRTNTMSKGLVERVLVGIASGALLGLGLWVWRKYFPPRESDTLKEVCEKKPAADTETKSKSPWWFYDSLRDGPLWRFLLALAVATAAGSLIALIYLLL
jgi:hypothetical protein